MKFFIDTANIDDIKNRGLKINNLARHYVTIKSSFQLLNVGYQIISFTFQNIIFALVIWLCEGNKWIKHTACKLVQYDKINLVTPDKYDEMVADLKKRLGLDIVKVEIGAVDFLRDMAVLKVYYKPQNDDVNTIDGIIKLNKEQWAQKDS